MTSQDKLITRISRLVMRTNNLIKINWKSVSIVFDVDDSVVSSSGFAYREGKTIPITAAEADLNQALRDLRCKLQISGQKPFTQILIQLRRKDGRFHIDFDYGKPGRWTIRPEHFATMRESLRPVFSDDSSEPPLNRNFPDTG